MEPHKENNEINNDFDNNDPNRQASMTTLTTGWWYQYGVGNRFTVVVMRVLAQS